MLSEFVDKIATLARESSDLQIEHDQVLQKVFVVRGGEVVERDLPPKPRGGTLLGIDDLVTAAQDAAVAPAPEIWHSSDQIVLVCDRALRHERVKMPLYSSDRFRTLRAMADKNGSSWSPRDLLKLLRFELPNSGVESVIAGLRKVDFSRRSEGRSTTEHGRESLGRSVEAAVQQTEDIPSEFVAVVPVYANSGLVELTSQAVTLVVYVDVENERIVTRPAADALERAVMRAQEMIGDELRRRLPQTPVFHGTP